MSTTALPEYLIFLHIAQHGSALTGLKDFLVALALANTNHANFQPPNKW